jgi:hypothetical protein
MAKKLILVILLLTVLVLGLFIYKDYGFGADETVNRKNGAVTLNYTIGVINHIFNTDLSWRDAKVSEYSVDLNNYRDRDYGVAFDLPILIVERVLQLNDSAAQYQLRHLATHLLFLCSLCAFYFLIKDRYKNSLLALMGTGMLYLSPRFFGESFYNNKDIAFCSIFLIASYFSFNFFKKTDLKNALLAAVFTGFAIDIRIIAIMLPVLILAAFGFKFCQVGHTRFNSKMLTTLSVYWLTSTGITIAFWPWLWGDPFGHFIEAFRNMANFRWLSWVLYRGHFYTANELPWYYLPGYIIVTTPFVYLFFSAIGIFAFIRRYFVTKLRSLTDNDVVDLIFMGCLIAPLGAAIVLKSTVYDGWRQFYFIYPAILYLAIRGLQSCWLIKYQRVLTRGVMVCVLALNTAYIGWWLLQNHPNQHTYFNVLAGKAWAKNFEVDYWGVTNVQALKYILNCDESPNIKIGALGFTALPQALLLLPEFDRNRVNVVLDVNDAEYVVTNFRTMNNAKVKSDGVYVEHSFHSVYQILVDGNAVGEVYKKNQTIQLSDMYHRTTSCTAGSVSNIRKNW